MEEKLESWNNCFANTVQENSFLGFSMHYQPIFTIDSDYSPRLKALESLMRYSNKGKSVSPEHFIPFAEKHNMITAVGDYALRAALDDFSKVSNESISLNVNISYQQFFHHWFAETVIAYLSANNIKPSQLTLEITESAYITDFELVNDVIRTLREFGVKFALDDFGTGYSNLSLLSKIDYDTIKIDRTCTEDICVNKNAFYVMKHFYAMSNELNKTVVVEGVETQEQLDLLLKIGYRNFQGWYFSKAKLISDFI